MDGVRKDLIVAYFDVNVSDQMFAEIVAHRHCFDISILNQRERKKKRDGESVGTRREQETN